MATLQELETALRNADAAGDVDAARQLAAEFVRVRGRSRPDAGGPLKITVRPQDANPAEGTQPGVLENIHQTASDAAFKLNQGTTFGFGDELVAAGLTPIEMGIGLATGGDEGKGLGERISGAYGRAIGKVRGHLKQAEERSPVASTAAEIGGGILSAGGLAKQGVTLLNPATQGYRQMIGRGAAEGAAYGGIHGLGTGEGLEDRAQKAAGGAATGAVVGGAFGAVGARAANRAASQATPTGEGLREAANLAYKEAENANVIIRPERYQAMVNNVFTKISNEGVNPTLHPGVMAAFKELETLKGEPVPFKTLDILRRVANSAGRSITNKDEGRLAGHIVDEIDKLMNNLGPRDVLTGDGALAGEMIRAGRSLWSRSRKTEALEDLVESATNRVGANYTAAGFQTAIRQEVKAILNSKSRSRGFSESEIAIMKGIVRGGPTENLMRYIGKFSVRGPVTGAIAGAGVLSNPAVAIPMMGVAEGARAASAAMTNKRLELLMEAVRRGGPRVLNALKPEQRAIIDTAIASGEITLNQLGIPAAIGETMQSARP